MTSFVEASVMTEEQLAKLNPRHVLSLFKQTRNFGSDYWRDEEPSFNDHFNSRLKRVLDKMGHVPRGRGRRTSIRQERLHGKKNLKY